MPGIHTEPTAEPSPQSGGVVASMYSGVADPVHGDLADDVVRVGLGDLVRAVQTLTRTLSNAEHQIAVTLPEAARMMGMRDPQLVRELCDRGVLRWRHPDGKKTRFVSVQSMREYMGDITTTDKPRKPRTKTR